MKRLLVALLVWVMLAGAGMADGFGPTTATFQGTIALTAATSTSLVLLNVTMSPNSAALPLPGKFQNLTIIAPTTGCTFTINWFGGTATAVSGDVLTAGAKETVNLQGNAAAPTLFSTSGCATPTLVMFHN